MITQRTGNPGRYARYGLVRVVVRVQHQKHPMFIGLGTMVRLQHPTGHPASSRLPSLRPLRSQNPSISKVFKAFQRKYSAKSG